MNGEQKEKISQACNLQFTKDLIYLCNSMETLQKIADEEITGKIKFLQDEVIINLNENETQSGEKIQFKFIRQNGEKYRYLGFRIITS